MSDNGDITQSVRGVFSQADELVGEVTTRNMQRRLANQQEDQLKKAEAKANQDLLDERQRRYLEDLKASKYAEYIRSKGRGAASSEAGGVVGSGESQKLGVR